MISVVYLPSLVLLVYVVTGTTTTSDVYPLKVFSSLQSGELVSSELGVAGPYPAGVNLTLRCHKFGRQPSWWEGSRQLRTQDRTYAGGVLVSTLLVSSLSPANGGRMVTCRVAGTTITHDLRLAVTAPPSPLLVRLSRSSLGTSLVCSADRIAPELRLCWFKKGRTIKCQEAGAVSVATSAAGPRLTCRPQRKAGKASLSSVAEQGYMRMALAVERVVQLTQTETDLGMQLLHNCHRATSCQSCAKLRANNCYWYQGLNLCGHSDSSADAEVAELVGFKCPVEGDADLLKMRRWGPETEQVADDLNQGQSSEVYPVPARYNEVTEVTKSVTVFAVAIALTIGFACGVVLLYLIRVCYNRKLARSKSPTKHLDERLKQRTVMEKESCKKAEENVYSTKEELMKDSRIPQTV